MCDVKNNLKRLIILKRAHIEIETGKKANLGDIKREIAEECGATYHNIENIYKGVSAPSLGLAFRIARYFGVSVDDIFYIE